MNSADVTSIEAALVGAADPEIVALEARIRTAQLDADVAALDSLIADDLLFTGPDGHLANKAQDLQAHGSGTVRFRAATRVSGLAKGEGGGASSPVR